MHRVFIYETIKRGFPNDISGIIDHKFIGACRTVEHYPLVIGGAWHSPYLIDEPGTGHRVLGEVLEVDDHGLQALDRMEGTHVPNGYRRVGISVETDGGIEPFQAWAYVKSREAIEGIHTEPMEEYRHDPNYVLPSDRPRVF